jgi:hypothetical protein
VPNRYRFSGDICRTNERLGLCDLRMFGGLN